MATLTVNDKPFTIDLVIFDKDGTLIDFDHLWGNRTRRCLAALKQDHAASDELLATLSSSLGYNHITQQVAGDGPLATIPRAKLITITATVMYQHYHDMSWHEAEAFAEQLFFEYIIIPPNLTDLRGTTDLKSLFQRLRDAGIKIAVATADDRAVTERSLSLLGVSLYVDALVCGDDPFTPKPAPDGLLHLSQSLAIAPDRIMMVGDTNHDLLAGRNAAVSCCLGVLSGTGTTEMLNEHADVIVDSIADIKIAL